MIENATNKPNSNARSAHATMKNDDEEPPVWITVLKLLLIAVVLIGGTGLALWYVDQEQTRDQPPGLSTGINKPDWGIVTDSPLRPHR